jgi:hypothetical protein
MPLIAITSVRPHLSAYFAGQLRDSLPRAGCTLAPTIKDFVPLCPKADFLLALSNLARTAVDLLVKPNEVHFVTQWDAYLGNLLPGGVPTEYIDFIRFALPLPDLYIHLVPQDASQEEQRLITYAKQYLDGNLFVDGNQFSPPGSSLSRVITITTQASTQTEAIYHEICRHPFMSSFRTNFPFTVQP